jgi:MoxR-like ATPase
MRFEGTSGYVATEDLKVAVNAAIALERPLLVKGEPGTGKTVLALEIAEALGAPLIEWHIKSTTKALQGLYEYDAVTRLRDSQLGDARVKDIRNYIKRGKLWEAFIADERPVLLIDKIGRYRISQRSSARTRPHGILRLRDRRNDSCAPAADCRHYLKQ